MAALSSLLLTAVFSQARKFNQPSIELRLAIPHVNPIRTYTLFTLKVFMLYSDFQHCLPTHSLSSQKTAVLLKLIVSKPVKKFSIFYESRPRHSHSIPFAPRLILTPFYSEVFGKVPLLQVSPPQPCMGFSSPPYHHFAELFLKVCRTKLGVWHRLTSPIFKSKTTYKVPSLRQVERCSTDYDNHVA